ncbi:hypothetical protein QEN19_004319 [Hanseniaspora menglaensis]
MSFFNFDYTATNSSLPHPVIPLPINQASTNSLSYKIGKNYKKMSHLFKKSQFYTGDLVPLDILDRYNKVDDGVERYGDKYKHKKLNKLIAANSDDGETEEHQSSSSIGEGLLDHPFHLEFIPQELKSAIKKNTNNNTLQKQAASSNKLLNLFDPESNDQKKESEAGGIDDIDFNKEFSKYVNEEAEKKEAEEAGQEDVEEDEDEAFDDEDDGDYDAENYFDNGEDDYGDDGGQNEDFF